MSDIYKGKNLNTDTHKYCPKCDSLKQRIEYNKNKKRNDGLDSYCKICSYEYRINRLRANEQAKKRHSEAARRYRKNNPEKTLLTYKLYRERNKEKIAEKRKSKQRRDYNRDYMRNLRSDPVFKLKSNISRQINHILKRNCGSKRGQTILDKLGYSIQQLKQHLESQFDSNMTWDNYGIYWHVDHIIPHSSFKYSDMDDDEFRRCWCLSNLRPLEAIENIKKSNKMPENKHDDRSPGT